MSTPTYNSNANPFGMTEATSISTDTKAKIWNRILQMGVNTKDDFTKLEGPSDSSSPFWKKNDLKAQSGDKVVFNTIGEAAGPGARGEVELTGRTSQPRLGAYTCQVDFFRDAVELTKKDLKFLATGASIERVLLEMLGKKMGRKRMYDMMHCLMRTTNATFLRPGGRLTRDTLTSSDTLSTSFMVDAKAQLESLGAQPIESRKSSVQGGAPIQRYLSFIAQNPMRDIRTDTAYNNACLQAAERSVSGNPLFTGALPDWQGMLFWEHMVVNPDSNDAIGSPITPIAKLGVAITDADATFVLKGGDGLSTLNEFFRDFPGYDYLFTEDQTPVADSASYYFWVVNTSGADIGKFCFYKYTGSTNSGNQITAITERLYSSTTGTYRKATVGNVTYAAANAAGLGVTFAHPAGSWIIAANANGVPIARSFILGAGAAMRAYGAYEMEPIAQDRDYKFVKGMGYEGIWGQRACLDTQGVPRNYVVLEHAYDIPGITLPPSP